jgi:hypothetical protein
MIAVRDHVRLRLECGGERKPVRVAAIGDGLTQHLAIPHEVHEIPQTDNQPGGHDLGPTGVGGEWPDFIERGAQPGSLLPVPTTIGQPARNPRADLPKFS